MSLTEKRFIMSLLVCKLILSDSYFDLFKFILCLVTKTILTGKQDWFFVLFLTPVSKYILPVVCDSVITQT